MTRGLEYIESELRHPSALRFASPEAAALQALREQLVAMPVKPYRADRTGRDQWDNIDLLGPLDSVIERVAAQLRSDFAEHRRTLSGVANWEVVLTNSNLSPNALHVLVVLTPTSRDRGSIIYGARVQRVDRDAFALWSDI